MAAILETYLVVSQTPIVVTEDGISTSYSPGSRFEALSNNLSIIRLLELGKIILSSGALQTGPVVISTGPAGPAGPAGPPSPPSGAATGDLAANYPNPEVAAITALEAGALDNVIKNDGAGGWVVGAAPGGGSLPPGTTVEVEAGGDLVTELGSTAGVYLSGDVDVASQIAITAGRYLFVAPGTVITVKAALAANNLFLIDSEIPLTIVCPGSFTVRGESGFTGNYLRGNLTNGIVNIEGTMVLDSATNDCAADYISGVKGVVEGLEIQLQAATSSQAVDGNGLYVENMALVAKDTSTGFSLTGITCGTVTMSGTWRSYTSGSITNKTALHLQYKASVETLVGKPTNSGLLIYQTSQSYLGVIVDADSKNMKSAVSIGSMGPRLVEDRSSILLSDTASSNKVHAPYTSRNWTAVAGAVKYTLLAPGIFLTQTLDNLSKSKFIGGLCAGAITMDTTFADNDIVGHTFDNGLTITAGSANNRFTNVYFASALTVPAGTASVFTNCRFAGALTISSGADSVFIGCHVASTFTNSDGLNSSVIGCHDGTGGGWWGNNDGRIEYKTTSVTTATTTELFIDATALQFVLASDDGVRFDIEVTGQRDNQEQVSFTALGLMAINNGGTTTLDGAITSGSADRSTQTGTAITLNASADDTNDSIKITVAHPAENWDFKAVLSNIIKINN